MDNRANLHDSLFSRNSTPPIQTAHNQPQPFVSQHNNSSSPNLIDSLFQHISAPSPDHQPPASDAHSAHSVESFDSASITPVTFSDEHPTPPSNTNHTAASLLSMIGGGPSAANRPQPPSQTLSQQAPSPPGSSSQRSNASPPHNDTQKILLEQLMGGSSRTTTYPDNQRANVNPQPGATPPHSQRDEYRNFNQHEHSNDSSPRAPTLQHSLLTQQQPPSPRRSMFEFTSPFDHLSTVKKRPVPPQPSSISSTNDDSGSWSTITDPKRQSVENLLENLTRGQVPHAGPTQPQPPAYESYLSGSDFSSPPDQSGARAPLPPIPAQKPVPQRNPSPRGSPPKNQTLHRPQPRAGDLNINHQVPHQTIPVGNIRRDKEGSPGPRGNNGARQKVVATQSKFTNKSQSSPSPHSQTIIFDVSQPLEEIQAREAVKSTAIALVKQDSIYLPGSTIGATHWVAYAMSRGRVRVISRSSGDRTLLQLPQVFSTQSSVIDMAVFGNRLAGVTTDGGFVVWELPELITDDVPGRILLCVPPTNGHEGLRAVKWHPKEEDTLAVASDTKIYVIDLANTHALHGQPLPVSDLHHIGQLFTVTSNVVAFDFDVVHYAFATISEDSSLTIWNMHDRLPYAMHTIRGEDTPSSLTFVDGGIVIGRKNGTIFQLLSMSTKTVLSTIKFINGMVEDPEMYGHVSYDSRIQTLWVANSRRESLIALKINIEPSFSGGEESVRGHIDQVAEFGGIKPTIHFVILTADADPHGDEAHAACVAAKVPPGELALVAFSVHYSGVDQILIRKEWFDQALEQAERKFPIYDLPSAPVIDIKPQQQRQPLPIPPNAPQQQLLQPASVSFAPPPTSRTPPSDEIDNEYAEGRLGDQKGKAKQGKIVNWKEKEETAKEKEKAPKADAAIINDSSLGQALSREIKKTEESLHNRIGRLIGKEMDKQHQRFEEARLHEQAEDFARQEKILKLISTELTRNTTRVVEMAVKSEIQNSVLPSLENITKSEVKAALNDQIGLSLVDVINRSLPVEMEKLLLRPNISNHFANILSTALTPMVEHHIKEVLTTTFFQFHSQQTASMHQDLLRELRGEISNIKSELGTWHNEAMRTQEATIRDLEHTVRALADQVKFLSINSQPSHHHLQTQQPQNSPGGPSAPLQSNINTSHLRQAVPPVPQPPVPSYAQNHPPFQPPPQQQPPIHQQWYSGIAAPQASHPATIPQAPAPQPQPEPRTPPVKADQWDEIYLGVLHAQDPTKLRDLLSRTNPEVVLPLNGTPLVSQAVILTLVHRLSAVVGETAPNDELFKTSLWWLQRVAGLLRPEDKLISDFIPRVIPVVQQSLNTTKQRLAILPGGSATMETARALSDVQEALRRKVAQ
ncbi:hypothetical protein B0H34DRAFT_764448 [Crassisporium funariophilum]|nr:hypothetical protein B0H34DRAFT_764448 [Crassisporium funariophilum]